MTKHIYATGKKKTSIARVYLKKGNGNIEINKLNNYFQKNQRPINIVKKPLDLLNIENKFDFKITVKGGGLISQAEAIKHGISKTIKIFEEKTNNKDKELKYKKQLKKLGFLTRDSRVVERKKTGYKKARKKEQYSKR